MSLEEYLKQRFRLSTVVAYSREINNYQSRNPSAQSASYRNIIDYIGALRKEGSGKSKLQLALLSIKQYYFFLMQTGQRKAHPCRYLTLKDKPSKYIQLQDLFSEKELELLLERKERYKILEKRNRVVIGLLLYQGLTTGEITRLALADINLQEGLIYIKSSAENNSRQLGLRSNQILPLHEYIREVRPGLLLRNKKKSGGANDKLILTWRGTTENGEGIDYLISTYKHLFPGRNLNPRTIRQSVVTNLLKQGKDLRIVQAYMGHKSPDTTEKYKQSNVEQLKAEIDKYHPMR